MPYPSQVQRADLIDKARELIESEGLDRLTLQSLAAAFGIAAPSLYHHFRNKTALLAAVNATTASALVEAMLAAASQASAEDQADPTSALIHMLHGYRMFAHAHPVTYSMVFANTMSALKPDPKTAEALVLPLQEIMARVVGAAKSLPALRGGWALVHGFVMLELAGQFQRGGDLDNAFETAVRTYMDGLRQPE